MSDTETPDADDYEYHESQEEGDDSTEDPSYNQHAETARHMQNIRNRMEVKALRNKQQKEKKAVNLEHRKEVTELRRQRSVPSRPAAAPPLPSTSTLGAKPHRQKAWTETEVRILLHHAKNKKEVLKKTGNSEEKEKTEALKGISTFVSAIGHCTAGRSPKECARKLTGFTSDVHADNMHFLTYYTDLGYDLPVAPTYLELEALLYWGVTTVAGLDQAKDEDLWPLANHQAALQARHHCKVATAGEIRTELAVYKAQQKRINQQLSEVQGEQNTPQLAMTRDSVQVSDLKTNGGPRGAFGSFSIKNRKRIQAAKAKEKQKKTPGPKLKSLLEAGARLARTPLSEADCVRPSSNKRGNTSLDEQGNETKRLKRDAIQHTTHTAHSTRAFRNVEENVDNGSEDCSSPTTTSSSLYSSQYKFMGLEEMEDVFAKRGSGSAFRHLHPATVTSASGCSPKTTEGRTSTSTSPRQCSGTSGRVNRGDAPSFAHTGSNTSHNKACSAQTKERRTSTSTMPSQCSETSVARVNRGDAPSFAHTGSNTSHNKKMDDALLPKHAVTGRSAQACSGNIKQLSKSGSSKGTEYTATARGFVTAPKRPSLSQTERSTSHQKQKEKGLPKGGTAPALTHQAPATATSGEVCSANSNSQGFVTQQDRSSLSDTEPGRSRYSGKKSRILRIYEDESDSGDNLFNYITPASQKKSEEDPQIVAGQVAVIDSRILSISEVNGENGTEPVIYTRRSSCLSTAPAADPPKVRNNVVTLSQTNLESGANPVIDTPVSSCLSTAAPAHTPKLQTPVVNLSELNGGNGADPVIDTPRSSCLSTAPPAHTGKVPSHIVDLSQIEGENGPNAAIHPSGGSSLTRKSPSPLPPVEAPISTRNIGIQHDDHQTSGHPFHQNLDALNRVCLTLHSNTSQITAALEQIAAKIQPPTTAACVTDDLLKAMGHLTLAVQSTDSNANLQLLVEQNKQLNTSIADLMERMDQVPYQSKLRKRAN